MMKGNNERTAGHMLVSVGFLVAAAPEKMPPPTKDLARALYRLTSSVSRHNRYLFVVLLTV
jgi:hypothetical protein